MTINNNNDKKQTPYIMDGHVAQITVNFNGIFQFQDYHFCQAEPIFQYSVIPRLCDFKCMILLHNIECKSYIF